MAYFVDDMDVAVPGAGRHGEHCSGGVVARLEQFRKRLYVQIRSS